MEWNWAEVWQIISTATIPVEWAIAIVIVMGLGIAAFRIWKDF